MLRLMSQIIPSTEQNDEDAAHRPSRKTVDRPNFSLQAMSNNFRRFNARYVNITSSLELR
jgi:hypothetical protein